MTKPSVAGLRRALRKKASPKKAAVYRSFFKTGPGEYGEGDVFIGITVPELRNIAKEFGVLTLPDLKKLLRSKIHEERLVALFILVAAFEKSKDEAGRRAIFDFYLDNLAGVNNWDLVDSSAAQIAGAWLHGRTDRTLEKLSLSKNLWERRVAIVATFAFIRRNSFDHTFRFSERFFSDPHDLIHKASGWMLREVGKRDTAGLRRFLDRHHPRMPRTMLRYAIEKFTPSDRLRYLRSSK